MFPKPENIFHTYKPLKVSGGGVPGGGQVIKRVVTKKITKKHKKYKKNNKKGNKGNKKKKSKGVKKKRISKKKRAPQKKFRDIFM